MKQHFFAALFYIALVLPVAGCGSIPLHMAVPADKFDQAVIGGYPADIRSWDGAPRKDLGRKIESRVEMYMKENGAYYKKNGKYPPMNYLAISGGGEDGAFAAGILNGWSEAGTRPEFAVVTGVSTGALIAPFAFLGPEYDDELKSEYTTVAAENIFVQGFWTMLDGLMFGMAVTDVSPLKERLDRAITPDFLAKVAAEHKKGRVLLIATTNIEAQRTVVWNMGAIAASNHPDAVELFKKIMLASAAIPGMFEPVFIDVNVDGQRYQELHVDGGVTAQVFLFPIKSSRMDRDAFLSNKIERNVYIVRNGRIAPEYQAITPGVVSISKRAIDTLTKYQGIGDLYQIYALCRRDGMNYNLSYIPDNVRNESGEMFNPDYMRHVFAVGEDMGRKGDFWQQSPPGYAYID